MFQLIVAVISIALVAALAIASIFYGGDAFTKSSEKANVTTLVNQGQQISGAAQLYKTDNAVLPATVEALQTSGYLSVVPSPSKIAKAGGTDGWKLVTVGTGAAAKTYAIVEFINAATGTSLCAAGGEVAKQNGLCLNSSGATGTTHFGFAL